MGEKNLVGMVIFGTGLPLSLGFVLGIGVNAGTTRSVNFVAFRRHVTRNFHPFSLLVDSILAVF